MSCLELVKLVKAYTHGEIPLEIYRETRREIINEFTGELPPPPPVNKNDPLESFLASKPQPPAANHKPLYLAIAAVTTVVLAIGIVVFLKPWSGSEDAAPAAQNEAVESADQPKAQKLIGVFLQADQWNEESVNQFILDWQILSAEERQQAAQSAWFKQFQTAIQNHLETEKKSSKNRQSVDLITSLMATVDPGYFLSGGSFFGQSSTASVQHPPSAASAPVAAVEAKKPAAQAQAPQLAKTTPKAESKSAAKPPSAPAATQTAKATDSSAGEVLLTQFTQSFVSGNLKGLMQLFSPDATTNHHGSANEISSSYAELFQSTAKRELQFSDFSWKTAGGRLEGSGKYLAHLNPKGTNIEQIFSADVSILVDASSQPAVINGLYLSNQQFSTALAEGIKTAVPEAQILPPPDQEELRKLLTNFVSSYNRGDVDALMALFSQEARTNDRANIGEIRQDYAELFQTTKSREIVLSNVDWKFSANKAVASGLFEAKIQPINNAGINVYRGKIRISVTKYEGGILITQLLHNTQ